MRHAAAVMGGAMTAAAAAQEPPFRFEITPYAGYRIGGEFEQSESEDVDANGRGFELDEGNAEGLILDILTSAGNSQWEVLYAHQDTNVETLTSFVGAPELDIDVSHLQFGGTYFPENDSEAIAPFIALTAGLARFEPDLDGLEAENYFSWSLGGGVQLRADRRIGVRLEARVFGSLIDDDSALFCVVSPEVNSCALFVEGDQLYQFEARVGVVARF